MTILISKIVAGASGVFAVASVVFAAIKAKS